MIAGRRRLLLPEWMIPLGYATCAIIAGLLIPRLEERFMRESISQVSTSVSLTMLSAITSGMIALTGIVFSLAFVMVQFSAVAYSPRLVMWVSRDPIIWHSVGIFTATFLYGIGVMAWIDRAGSGKVPFYSTWLVIVLTLMSVVMFVGLIQRLGMLQISRMLTFTGNLGRQVIEQIYPSFETPASVVLPDELSTVNAPRVIVYSGGPKALQAIDQSRLFALAIRTHSKVEVRVSVGDTLIAGMPLLRVYGSDEIVSDEIWKKAFELGPDRTFEKDPKYALRLLVDIAIKALSPAVNDPTTAVQALDQIEDLLLRLGRRRVEVGAIRDAAGELKLVIPYPTWEDFLQLAFDEIRSCGATSIQVMRRMRALMSDLVTILPQERHEAVYRHQKRLDATIERSFPDSEEKLEASIEDRQGLGLSRIVRTASQAK